MKKRSRRSWWTHDNDDDNDEEENGDDDQEEDEENNNDNDDNDGKSDGGLAWDWSFTEGRKTESMKRKPKSQIDTDKSHLTWKPEILTYFR